MKAAFDKNYAKRLDGDNVKDCKTRWEINGAQLAISHHDSLLYARGFGFSDIIRQQREATEQSRIERQVEGIAI